MENHILQNGMGKDNQIGFTTGGRTEYNHFILQYLVERAHKKEEELFFL